MLCNSRKTQKPVTNPYPIVRHSREQQLRERQKTPLNTSFRNAKYNPCILKSEKAQKYRF